MRLWRTSAPQGVNTLSRSYPLTLRRFDGIISFMPHSYFERDIWEEPERLKGWQQRVISFELFRDIVNDACQDFVDDAGPNIEIGSGLGALGEYMQGTPVHAYVEGNLPTALEHQAKIADSQSDHRIINGDLYNLPFRSESVSSVLGLLVIDAMFDMQAVTEKISRVLKPCGTLVYFHDNQASMNAVGTQIRQEGSIPVPINKRRIASMDENEFKRFIKLARRQWRGGPVDIELIVDALTQDRMQFDWWRMEAPDLVNAITDVVEGDRKLKRAVLPHITDVFASLLSATAEATGLEVIRNNAIQHEMLLPRDEAQHRGAKLTDEENGIYLSAFGNSGVAYIPEVPEGQVAVGLEILSVVARKKS